MARVKPLHGVILLAVAFSGLAAYGLKVPADASHRIPDGALYRFQAQTLASGHLVAPAPPMTEPFRFLPMLRMTQGRWFGPTYPGFALLLLPGLVLGADWLINPLLGGLLIFGTSLLGRRLGGDAVGFLAALVMATAPLHLTLATTYLSHVACACLLTYAMLLLVARAPHPTVRGLLAGLLFGWGVAIRPYTSVWLFLPAAAILLARSRPWTPARLRTLGAFAAGAVPWALAILAWNRMLTGDPVKTPYSFWWDGLRLGFVDLARTRIFDGTAYDRYTPFVAWLATKRQLAGLPTSLFPLPGVVGVALLLAPMAAARWVGRRVLVWITVPLALVAGYFLYPGTLGVAAMIPGPRFYFEALPVLAILVAFPAALLWRRHRIGRLVVAVVAATVVVLFSVRAAPNLFEWTRAAHRNPLVGGNRILERFLADLEDGRRLVFVDVSTYQLTSALLVNSPDLSADHVVVIYWEPETNRQLMDRFPGHTPWLFRWNAKANEPELTPYDPDEDATGPPNGFPYNRLRRRSS